MIRDDPIQLVDIRYEGGRPVYVLKEAAEELLNTLDDKLISVVGIAGPARSGKSFLANMLLEKMAGFQMGSSTMPCTKGIWIWGKPKIVGETAMLVIDTEGLHSQQRDAAIDAAILGITMLLSSVLVYNK